MEFGFADINSQTRISDNMGFACSASDHYEWCLTDTPFVYAIVENETGIPVFVGCQNSME